MYQKEKKLNPVLLIVLAVVLLAVGIAVWFLLTHVRVAGTFYSRSAEVLDLRFADITTADYEKLRKKAPNSEILWRIPFQGKTYDQNTDVLYVTSLTDEDVATLDYFTQLKSVEAQECTDYAQLTALAARRPAVAVDYAVTIDGRKYDQDTAVVSVSDITEEEIGLLTYLPDLTAVTAVGCETPEQMEKLRDFCQEKGISFALRFGTKTYPDTVQELDVTGITDAELELLQLLPELKTLHLVNPEADPATVLQLRSTYPKVSINWEVEMAGISFPDDTKEVDLSAALEITTTDKTTTQTAATTKVTTGTVTRLRRNRSLPSRWTCRIWKRRCPICRTPSRYSWANAALTTRSWPPSGRENGKITRSSGRYSWARSSPRGRMPPPSCPSGSMSITSWTTMPTTCATARKCSAWTWDTWV